MSDVGRGEKVMKVTREAITFALLRDGPARCVALPDDVELEELWHSDDGVGFMLRVSSTEWPLVKEGEPLEQVNPTIEDVVDFE